MTKEPERYVIPEQRVTWQQKGSKKELGCSDVQYGGTNTFATLLVTSVVSTVVVSTVRLN